MSGDLILDAEAPSSLARAAAVLKEGGIVACPTETCYGLAADPLRPEALERLFRVKQRPRKRPVLVLVENMLQLLSLASEFPAAYRPLAERFWPGPLTLICPARPGLPRLLTGGGEDIALRRSSCATANRLLAAFGAPLTSTSANHSGDPPALSAVKAAQVFGDGVDLILDGGLCPGGGSTIAGLRAGALYCIREGRIPFAEVRTCAASGERRAY